MLFCNEKAWISIPGPYIARRAGSWSIYRIYGSTTLSLLYKHGILHSNFKGLQNLSDSRYLNAKKKTRISAKYWQNEVDKAKILHSAWWLKWHSVNTSYLGEPNKIGSNRIWIHNTGFYDEFSKLWKKYFFVLARKRQNGRIQIHN